jgi:hypothetical protein
VRKSLVIEYCARTDASALPGDIQARDRLGSLFHEVHFDFALAEAIPA